MKKNISIYGMGFVGFPLLLLLAKSNQETIGVDTSETLIQKLKKGIIPFYEKNLQKFYKKIKDNKKITFTSKLSSKQHKKTNVYIICVGTPLINIKKTDNRALLRVAKEISKNLNNDDLIILRSTVNIGTTRDLLLPVLNKSKKQFHISFCPERTLEGDSINELIKNPQIISSNTKFGLNETNKIFKLFLKRTIPVSSLETAELIKLMDNLYRNFNFSFANQIGILCDKIGIQSKEVIEGANKFYKRTNIAKPGPVGGPCLSKDPYIFASSLKKFKLSNDFIILSRKTNDKVVDEIADYITNFLIYKKNSRVNYKISFLGLAFKGFPVTDDIRSSNTLEIFKKIKNKLKNSKYYCFDPVVKKKVILENNLKYCSDYKYAFLKSDVVIICNNSNDFKKLNLKKFSHLMNKDSLIYDVWNLFDSMKIKDNLNCKIKSFGNFY